MKKLITLITALLMITVTAIAGDIKLTTTGIIISEPERNTGQGWDITTGSILVNIQGEIYVIEDTKMWKLRKYRINDFVLVCFHLNENDRISKLYIVD